MEGGVGGELDARPFAKSTLQEFWAQLIVHQEAAAIFRTSLELAKRRGKFRTKSGEQQKLKVALDATNILGQGAVKDTYNLLGDGIVKLARVLAKLSGQPLAAWAEATGYGRYGGQTSLKGTAEIDRSDSRNAAPSAVSGPRCPSAGSTPPPVEVTSAPAQMIVQVSPPCSPAAAS